MKNTITFESDEARNRYYKILTSVYVILDVTSVDMEASQLRREWAQEIIGEIEKLQTAVNLCQVENQTLK